MPGSRHSRVFPDRPGAIRPGLLGEYVGRIYQVRHRPRYVIDHPRVARAQAKAGASDIASARNLAGSRAVRLAYHNVGVRCLRVLLTRASTSRWC